MPTSNKPRIYIDLPLHNIGTSQLKRLLQKNWIYVDIRHRDCDASYSGQWDDALSSIIAGLLNFNYDPEHELLWQRTIFILHRLLDNGWQIYAGYGDGVLCAVLTNSTDPFDEGIVERVQLPHDLMIASKDNRIN
jgi:hypothetical protein